jgi:hypothetical protein
MSDADGDRRPLTTDERRLVQWMLEQSGPGGLEFLRQLELACVSSWHCPCGCASINLIVDGQPPPSGNVHPLADFVFGEGDGVSGIFVFERGGVLAGVEVYGLAGDAPKSLPPPTSLRPFGPSADAR